VDDQRERRPDSRWEEDQTDNNHLCDLQRDPAPTRDLPLRSFSPCFSSHGIHRTTPNVGGQRMFRPFFPFLPGSQRSCLFLSVTHSHNRYSVAQSCRPPLIAHAHSQHSFSVFALVTRPRQPKAIQSGRLSKASRSVGIQSQRSCRERKRLLPWRAG
jgi:hypothetical protein